MKISPLESCLIILFVVKYKLRHFVNKIGVNINMNTVRELWQEIIEKVKNEYFLTEVSFNTWLVPLKVYDVSEDTVTVIVPSQNEQTI